MGRTLLLSKKDHITVIKKERPPYYRIPRTAENALILHIMAKKEKLLKI